MCIQLYNVVIGDSSCSGSWRWELCTMQCAFEYVAQNPFTFPRILKPHILPHTLSFLCIYMFYVCGGAVCVVCVWVCVDPHLYLMRFTKLDECPSFTSFTSYLVSGPRPSLHSPIHTLYTPLLSSTLHHTSPHLAPSALATSHLQHFSSETKAEEWWWIKQSKSYLKYTALQRSQKCYLNCSN